MRTLARTARPVRARRVRAQGFASTPRAMRTARPVRARRVRARQGFASTPWAPQRALRSACACTLSACVPSKNDARLSAHR
eukprot:5886056-Pleurochrysis_carterae.AAC.1